MMHVLNEEQIVALIQFDYAALLNKIRKPGNTITKYDLVRNAIEILKECESQGDCGWARTPERGFMALKDKFGGFVLIYEFEQLDNNL